MSDDRRIEPAASTRPSDPDSQARTDQERSHVRRARARVTLRIPEEDATTQRDAKPLREAGGAGDSAEIARQPTIPDSAPADRKSHISVEIPVVDDEFEDKTIETKAVEANGFPEDPTLRRLPEEPESEDVQFEDEPASEPSEIEAEDLLSVQSAPSSQRMPAAPPARKPSNPPMPAAAPVGHLPKPVPPPAAATVGGYPLASGATGAALPPVATPPVSTRAVPAALPAPSPLAPPAMTEAAAMQKRTRPWWVELFNDDYLRTMIKVTDDQIAEESNFIEESLGVQKGAMVLDLACGTGLHAIEMTRRGYQVVGFDLSLAMLARAADEAHERKQRLNFVQGDMRDMSFEETFDGVYCWNTSFGFFDEEKNQQVVQRVHRALRRGGQFLLDIANRDFVLAQTPSLAWFEGEGCVCMDEMQIDFITSRMRVKRTMMMDDGRSREIEYSMRVYSLHELGKILNDSGFRVVEVSGRTATPGVFLGADSPRMLILAEKR